MRLVIGLLGVAGRISTPDLAILVDSGLTNALTRRDNKSQKSFTAKENCVNRELITTTEVFFCALGKCCLVSGPKKLAAHRDRNRLIHSLGFGNWYPSSSDCTPQAGGRKCGAKKMLRLSRPIAFNVFYVFLASTLIEAVAPLHLFSASCDGGVQHSFVTAECSI